MSPGQVQIRIELETRSIYLAALYSMQAMSLERVELVANEC